MLLGNCGQNGVERTMKALVGRCDWHCCTVSMEGLSQMIDWWRPGVYIMCLFTSQCGRGFGLSIFCLSYTVGVGTWWGFLALPSKFLFSGRVFDMIWHDMTIWFGMPNEWRTVLVWSGVVWTGLGTWMYFMNIWHSYHRAAHIFVIPLALGGSFW